jgi:hypothetical protein
MIASSRIGTTAGRIPVIALSETFLRTGFSGWNERLRLLAEDCSAVEHRPADVISQPLVVKNEFANRLG